MEFNVKIPKRNSLWWASLSRQKVFFQRILEINADGYAVVLNILEKRKFDFSLFILTNPLCI